jgi:hypothetical protein
MKSYQYRFIQKTPGTEINIARMLQPVDFSQLKVDIEESKLIQDEKKSEGPRKSTVSVSSRRFKKEDKPTEYSLKCQINEKTKSWLGKSEESSKYAVLVFDGQEVRILLTDHWYKFSPVFSTVNLEVDKELKLGKVKRQREEAQLEKEVLGEDSDEDKVHKKPHIVSKDLEEDNDNAKEGMDFNEEFTDDEEVVDEEEELEEAALQHGLSNSGKELQKVLLDNKSESFEESGNSSDIGLSEDEGSKEGINKQAIINELMRLGRTTIKDLISECSKKFKSEPNLKLLLTDIIREVGEITGTGENAEIVLKEEYKRVMPSFGVRIKFITNKK